MGSSLSALACLALRDAGTRLNNERWRLLADRREA